MIKKDLDLENNWQSVLNKIEILIGKKPKDMNAVLFLVGVQELGKGYMTFSKEEKQDLMHLGICKVLSYSGFYELEGIDSDGWPHWNPLKPIPNFDVGEQEKLLKMHVIEYFDKEFSVQE